MSGGSVPYHLRQHKAVERGVFIDLLLRLGRATDTNIRSYRYIGFAGPFSEDFKLVHAHVGISKFVSLEQDEWVLKRQKWNAPLRGIDYRRATARDYIESFEPLVPSIIWLDYASPRELADQMAEVETLISKCADYDVLKVTFNASHATLGGPPGVPADQAAVHRVTEAQRRLGDYLPSGFDVTSDDVDRKGYPSLVLKAAEIAIKNGMRGKAASRFQLLTSFIYSDSAHRMLTLTGIILPKGRVSSFLRETGVGRGPFAITKWGTERTVPIDISIPEMSLRERLFVDQQLPRRGSPRSIMKKLGFKLADGVDDRTLQALASYRDFYRYFPYFSKMVV